MFAITQANRKRCVHVKVNISKRNNLKIPSEYTPVELLEELQEYLARM
jgi:hypothetical protein